MKTRHAKLTILPAAPKVLAKRSFDSPADRNPVIQKFSGIPKTRYALGIRNPIKENSALAAAIRAKQALIRYTPKAESAPTIALVSLLSDLHYLTDEIGISFTYELRIP